jgi:hypothetical protein
MRNSSSAAVSSCLATQPQQQTTLHEPSCSSAHLQTLALVFLQAVHERLLGGVSRICLMPGQQSGVRQRATLIAVDEVSEGFHIARQARASRRGVIHLCLFLLSWNQREYSDGLGAKSGFGPRTDSGRVGFETPALGAGVSVYISQGGTNASSRPANR